MWNKRVKVDEEEEPLAAVPFKHLFPSSQFLKKHKFYFLQQQKKET